MIKLTTDYFKAVCVESWLMTSSKHVITEKPLDSVILLYLSASTSQSRVVGLCIFFFDSAYIVRLISKTMATRYLGTLGVASIWGGGGARKLNTKYLLKNGFILKRSKLPSFNTIPTYLNFISALAYGGSG